MKLRDVIPALVVAVVLTSTVGSSGVGAQDGLTAEEIGRQVEAFYGARRTVRARFSQFFWSRAYRRTQTSRGRIVIQRPDRIRFDYDPPSSRVLLSDGHEWLMYEPIEGGPGQFTRGRASARSTAGLSILMGAADLGTYRHSLRRPGATDPPNTVALELVPRQTDPQYRRIILFVDTRTQFLGAVWRVSIEDFDGNWNRFDFSDVEFDQDLEAETFRFVPPAGAREIVAPSSR